MGRPIAPIDHRYRAIRVQPIHNELGSAGVPGDPTYTAETEREALRLTLEALEVERRHLAAWSSGGTAVIEFATEYPDRVRSLTLVEPGAHWILEQLGESPEAIDRYNQFIHGLFGRPVTEDLATVLELAGLIEKVQDARTHPIWDRWLSHRTTLSWLGEQLDHPRRLVAETFAVVTVSADDAAIGPISTSSGRGSFTEGSCTYRYSYTQQYAQLAGTMTIDGVTIEQWGSGSVFDSTSSVRCR